MAKVLDFKKSANDSNKLNDSRKNPPEIMDDSEKRKELTKIVTDSFVERKKAIMTTMRVSVVILVVFQLISIFIQIGNFSPFLFIVQIAMFYAFFLQQKNEQKTAYFYQRKT